MLVHDEVSICRFYLCACMIVYKSVTRINLPLGCSHHGPLKNIYIYIII